MNRVVFVFGATGDIGREVCKKFSEDILIVQYRNEDKLNKLKTEIGDKIAKSYQVDVTEYEKISNIFTQIYEEYKRIDVVINCCGITRDNLILKMSHDDFTSIIESNLVGVFNITKNAIKYMLKNKSGKIINISSIIGLNGNVGQSNYAASKAGIIAFTKSIAKEVARKNININAIAPGFIKTQMTKDLDEKFLEKIPARRFGKVEDISEVIYFLADDKSSYINGQTIVVDGGLSL